VPSLDECDVYVKIWREIFILKICWYYDISWH